MMENMLENFKKIFGILSAGFLVFGVIARNAFASGCIYALDCLLYRAWRALYWPPDDYHRVASCGRRHCSECQAQRLVKRIRRAKRCVAVVLESFYHKGLCRALMQAHLRGVHVYIFAPVQPMTVRRLVVEQLRSILAMTARRSGQEVIFTFACIDTRNYIIVLEAHFNDIVERVFGHLRGAPAA